MSERKTMEPYSVLGLNRDASMEQVNAAYRELLRKYDESNYVDNPLADLAAKKRQEINDAYDAIVKMRAEEKKRAEESTAETETKQTNTSSDPRYADVRAAIDSGNIMGAWQMLSAMKERDAEWYYLCGVVSLRRGLYNDAYSFFKTATNKDPLNMEYKEAFARMDRQAGAYRQAGPGMQQMDCCSCCNNLLIADCCCECMGGDIIPCC